jgi:hypothetical protein
MDSVGLPFGDIASLCLFGMPLDDIVDLELYSPDGGLLSTLSFQAVRNDESFATHDLISTTGEYVGNAWATEGMPVMEVYIWDSAGMPYGKWYAVAESATMKLSDAFLVLPESDNWATTPCTILSLTPDTPIHSATAKL